MTTVAAGSRLLVHGGKAPVVLRTLRAAQLRGGWSVDVIGDVAALQAAGLTGRTAVVEFPTAEGPMRLDVKVVQEDGSLRLQAPGLRAAAVIDQRRTSVRAPVRLPLRGAVLATASTSTRSQAAVNITADGARRVVLTGTTETVSSGGISLELPGADGISAGASIYVELEMPGGALAPAVLSVLDHDGRTLRARFVDISPLDRERLVRLVFIRQRAELAERRQRIGSAR